MIADAGTKLTCRDILALPEDGLRHELIDGEHYVTPSPVPRHQLIVGNLYFLLRSHLEVQPDGDVYLAPVDVVLSVHDLVVPDLMLFTPSRRQQVRARNVHGAPDLVIEVLSPSTARRDRTLKRALYQRAGVREYWLVDPKAETVTVWHGTRQERQYSADGDDRLVSPLLPDLRITLADVFRA